MTVETTGRKQNFDGGQADLVFAFRALPESPEDIKCLAISSAGEITPLVYNTTYTVAVNSNGIGGTVTVSPTFSTSYTHTVYRETTAKQESDYDDYNQFPADTLETNLDRLTMLSQEIQETQERTLKYPISEEGADTALPVPDGGSFLAWNDAGDAVVNKALPDPSTLVKASQAEAEAGTDDDTFMTPLKTKQSIDENAPTPEIASQADAEAGTNNTKTMTPLRVVQSIMKAVYPVGSVYFNATDDTNPASLLGFGTWSAFGAGRVPVGYTSADTDFNAGEKTGGAKTHTLTTAEMPAHAHRQNVWNGGAGTGVIMPERRDAQYGTAALNTQSTGGGGAHANLQPYITVYMWKRTA